MGRSVSRPRDAIAVAYRTLGGEYYCTECEEYSYDDTAECSHCGAETEYQAPDEHDWENLVEWIRETGKDAWGSLVECDEWLDREDHAILENSHCYIGMSEYCGLVSVWLVSKADSMLNTDDASIANLADHWCRQIANRFLSMFGEMTSIGHASNGEQFFQKIEEVAS